MCIKLLNFSSSNLAAGLADPSALLFLITNSRALEPEQVRDQSDKTGAGAEHRFEVSVISDAAGFMTAKDLAAAVSEALLSLPLVLSVGHLVSIGFQRATARRLDQGAVRRIDMLFRARIAF